MVATLIRGTSCHGAPDRRSSVSSVRMSVLATALLAGAQRARLMRRNLSAIDRAVAPHTSSCRQEIHFVVEHFFAKHRQCTVMIGPRSVGG